MKENILQGGEGDGYKIVAWWTGSLGFWMNYRVTFRVTIVKKKTSLKDLLCEQRTGTSIHFSINN